MHAITSVTMSSICDVVPVVNHPSTTNHDVPPLPPHHHHHAMMITMATTTVTHRNGRKGKEANRRRAYKVCHLSFLFIFSTNHYYSDNCRRVRTRRWKSLPPIHQPPHPLNMTRRKSQRRHTTTSSATPSQIATEWAETAYVQGTPPIVLFFN